jgi:hypothetical protein
MPDRRVLEGHERRLGLFRLDYDIMWHKVREDEEVCPYGDKHRVGVYHSAVLFKTDRTWTDEYYGQTWQAAIWEDECGCEVREKNPTDFHGRTYWIDSENKHWEKFSGYELARDIFGNPLTPKTPSL